MGSKRARYQVQDDRQKLGKYPIRVGVWVRVIIRVRAQLTTA